MDYIWPKSKYLVKKKKKNFLNFIYKSKKRRGRTDVGPLLVGSWFEVCAGLHQWEVSELLLRAASGTTTTRRAVAAILAGGVTVGVIVITTTSSSIEAVDSDLRRGAGATLLASVTSTSRSLVGWGRRDDLLEGLGVDAEDSLNEGLQPVFGVDAHLRGHPVGDLVVVDVAGPDCEAQGVTIEIGVYDQQLGSRPLETLEELLHLTTSARVGGRG